MSYRRWIIGALLGAGLVLSPWLSMAARAGISVTNLTTQAYKVTVALPSGETKDIDMDAAQGENLGQASMTSSIPDAVKTVQVTISDDMGAKVWSGGVGNDRSAVLYKDAAGKIVVAPAAWWVDAGQRKPQAVFLVNFTGKPLKVDLFAQNGTVGKKDVPVAAAVDFKTPTRLPAGDSTFYVHLKDASGQAVGESSNPAVFIGQVYALFTGTDNVVHVHELGLFFPPHNRK